MTEPPVAAYWAQAQCPKCGRNFHAVTREELVDHVDSSTCFRKRGMGRFGSFHPQYLALHQAGLLVPPKPGERERRRRRRLSAGRVEVQSYVPFWAFYYAVHLARSGSSLRARIEALKLAAADSAEKARVVALLALSGVDTRRFR